MQKLDKIHCLKEPEKLGTNSINWFESFFKITGCADCFEKNVRLLPITGFSDKLVKPVPNPNHTKTNPMVAWNPDHKPQWLFTTTPTWPRPNPAGIGIRYSMHEPGRTGRHEHPYYPLHHSCHTPEHLTQILTRRDLNPNTSYILHCIYSYLTQGQPEQGLIAMSPRAKHITYKGIGVYATPILQPKNPGGPPHHGPCHIRLPAHEPMPSPTTITGGPTLLRRRLRRVPFTPITGGATLQLTHTERKMSLISALDILMKSCRF